MTQVPRHSVSVAAVVTDPHTRVLVIQRRDNGAWQLPGGVLELDERIEDGVRREVREETGADIHIDRLTGIYKNMSIGVVALVFRAYLAGGTISPGDEAIAVEWWTPEQVAANQSEAFAIRIIDALEDTSQVAVRHHDGTRLIGQPPSAE
jgi:8-oxo-dGTP diphosphatase